MEQYYFCTKCNIKLEWKEGELFCTCKYCNLVHSLPDKEFEKAGVRLVGKGTNSIKCGITFGWIFGVLIGIAGCWVFYEGLLMPMIFAGQYLILGIIFLIVGTVVIALATKYGMHSLRQRMLQNAEIIRKNGEQLGVEFENESKGSNFCESCGNALKPTAKFCGSCGNQV